MLIKIWFYLRVWSVWLTLTFADAAGIRPKKVWREELDNKGETKGDADEEGGNEEPVWNSDRWSHLNVIIDWLSHRIICEEGF